MDRVIQLLFLLILHPEFRLTEAEPLQIIITLLQTILFSLQAVLSAIVGYLLMLTGAAFRARRTTPLPDGDPTHRFLFIIPAHNEERLLPSTLACLRDLDYPASLFAVHVVADNCTDQTAMIARDGGATAHERFNDELRGKGYALQWLLQRLWAANEPHDAVVILDADTVVSRNFLRVMDARLARGERVIQAYYAVRDPDQSWSVSLRYAALAVLHYLRPAGRMVLGGSTGLKGNGMVFARDIMQQHEWTASLTEDIELHMELILDGERAMFAPDAVVWAEMPDTLASAQTQNVRWERGRMEMIQNYVPNLLRQAWQRRSFLLFDAAIEQLIPPFSILAGSSVLAFLLALVVPGRRQRSEQPTPIIKRTLQKRSVWMSAFILLGQVVYLVAGLRLAQAPKAVYRALLAAPLFMAWKIWLYMRVLLGLDRKGWIRTSRNEE